MSAYLRALRESKLARKAQQERQDQQLADLTLAADRIVSEAREQANAERQQILAEARGDDGDIGPMPRHQWKGTKLRFEIQPDEWGKFVDLKGKPGSPGAPGRGGSGQSLAGLNLLQSEILETDTMIIERGGALYRISVADLKGAFALPLGTTYAGNDPVMAGSEYVTASDE